MKQRIRIEIDELVLHGIDTRDRMVVADAVTRELPALIAGGGILKPRNLERVDAGEARVQSPRDATGIGRVIADAVTKSVR